MTLIDVRFGDLHEPQDFIWIERSVREVVNVFSGLSEEQALLGLWELVCMTEYPDPSSGAPDKHVLRAFPSGGGYLINKSNDEFWQYPCFPPGSHILGSATVIEEVQPCHNVLCRDGHQDQVLNTMKRWYQGPLTELKVARLPLVRLTPEHPVLTVRRLWCNATTPCKRFCTQLKGSCLRCKKYRLWDWEPKFVPAKDLQPGDFVLIPRSKQEEIEQIASFKLDHKVCYLLGLYLAEGSTANHQVQFAFGKHERNLIARARSIIDTCGFRSGEVDTPTTTKVYFSSTPTAKFLREVFGAKAPVKRIPPFIKSLPHSMLRAFLEGYIDGDGCHFLRRNRDFIFISTRSEDLLFDLLEVGAKLGIPPRFSRNRRKTPAFINGRRMPDEWWNISMSFEPSRHAEFRIDDDFLYLPVRKINQVPYRGYVHNIETKSNTYCAPFIVHNCETLGWEDEQGQRYGDCEDTSILLCALYRAYGISPNRVKVDIGNALGGPHAWVDLGGFHLETTLSSVPNQPWRTYPDYTRVWSFNDVMVEGNIAFVRKVDEREKLRRIGNLWRHPTKVA